METPLAKFTNFTILPAELRIKIWHFSFHQRRLIEIRTGDYPAGIEYNTNAKGNKTSDIRWVTKCPPPSALSVCQEARSLALKFWTLRFALIGIGGCGEEVIYINPVLDTIYINVKHPRFLYILLRDIRSFDDTNRGVRSLALNGTSYSHTKSWILDKKKEVLQGLDTLTLVIEDYSAGRINSGVDDREEICTLVAPETERELSGWEHTEWSARHTLFESAEGRLTEADLRVVAIRRGKGTICLGNEEENIILQGPKRPYEQQFNIMPAVIPSRD